MMAAVAEKAGKEVAKLRLAASWLLSRISCSCQMDTGRILGRNKTL